MGNQHHICIITSSDISDGGIGGDGRYSILLYRWLKSKNIKCTLLGSKSFKIRNYDSSFGIDKPSLDGGPKKRSFAPYPLFMVKRLAISFILSVKIMQVHVNTPISLIHSQDTGYTGLAAIVIGKILKVPVAISSHGIRHKTIYHGLKSKIKKVIYPLERNLDLFTIRNANEVIVDNDSIKNYYEGIVKEKIRTIPIPIELYKFEYSSSDRILIRTDLGIEENSLVVGFIGRFAVEKNLLNLITAFSNVLQSSPQVKLLLVGAGPLESEMRALVNKLNIVDNVIFCGIRNDINRILSSCDIFILPSFTEGMSVALLEAMAAGTPVICSNIPTNAEIISNRIQGILIDPYNLDEIENAIIELLWNDKLRSELSTNAKKKVTQFDVDAVFPKILRSYEDQIGRSLL